MNIEIVETNKGPRALGPYSQATIAGGLVFCSGQVALDPRTADVVGPDDIRAQTKQAIANLKAVLEAAGSDLSHVTTTTVFITNFDEFAAMNEVYAEAFGAHRPARATVGVATLPRGVKLEIQCIAVLK